MSRLISNSSIAGCVARMDALSLLIWLDKMAATGVEDTLRIRERGARGEGEGGEGGERGE